MTRTDRFDDLDGKSADAIKAGLSARVAGHTRALHEEYLVLYAGANILTPSTRLPFDPTLSLMPAMGPPGDKEQPGSDLVASLEIFAARLARKVFGAAWADCRLPSCTIANLAVFSAFASPGAILLAPAASDGGHLSQRRGGTPSMQGLDVRELPFDALHQQLDSEAAAEQIRREKPAMVMLGRSVVLRPDDLGPVVAACRETGSLSVYDASHVAGLIAGGVFLNPLEVGVDLITTSTYKTLAGPTGAIVMGRDPEQGVRFAEFLDANLLANQNAARLPSLCGVLAEFAESGAYAEATIRIANRLKTCLFEAGLPVLLGDHPAETHQIVVPVGDLAETKAVMSELEAAKILVGRCPVPGRPGQHGLRFGIQLVARLIHNDPAGKIAVPFAPEHERQSRTAQKVLCSVERFIASLAPSS
ncbi:serine hydroxymethyltransferase [Fulvimarina pelagi HTCC2506]|uniref:Serine hydroxymethyltransferase n=1 Tax=Fulvimarina pelagi HTCC2506 TaxID=314231 RepID=Q0FXL6_9HYPH|nr:serine hydroxymethyltransferase [Fulvimarina pelagi]EAU39720.1 serine hydroxymethyltransferase [Fulvimarina pelagi HTCC2506]